MVIDLLNRYLKFLVLIVMFWTLLWSYQNIGFRTVQGEEMGPAIEQGSLQVLLSGKRLPPEVNLSDVVWFRQKPGRGEQTGFAGEVYAGPGDVVWLERKFISAEVRGDASLEVLRDAPPGDEASRFIKVIVPRDSWFMLCENAKQYSLHDSRGRGPVGFWSVEGRLRR